MSGIAAFFAELFGLFVDDGALALAIVMVVIAAGVIAALMPAAPLIAGAILLLGCLGVLFINVMQARQR